MRVLVAYGSKMGGTAGIAQLVGDALADAGFQVDAGSAPEVTDLGSYDAVVIGGAVYTGHWHRQARRLVKRHTSSLRDRPVWLFSSGPLNGSAAAELPPVPQVQELVERIGARGHVTFGGRPPAGAKGVPGQRHGQDPGRRLAGPERIRGWAADVAMALVSLDRPGQLHA